MICEYCGKHLTQRKVNVAGNMCVMGFHDCMCDGAVSAREAARDAERVVEQQRHAYRIAKAVRASGIPERYAKAELPEEKTNLYNIAVTDGLYLYGGDGRGKTHTACAIGIRAINEGISTRMVKAHRIGDMLTLGSMDDAIQLLVSPRLLIIDDIGADNVGEWSNSRLRAVIDERYDSMKPTVFTSNYSVKQLEDHLDKGDFTARAIVSRIKEMGEPILVTGKNWRENKQSC